MLWALCFYRVNFTDIQQETSMSSPLSHPVFTDPQLLTGLLDACILDGSSRHHAELQSIIDALQAAPEDSYSPRPRRC